MIQSMENANKSVSLYIEKTDYGFIFYHPDDLNKSEVYSVRVETLFGFVKKYETVGGLNFFFSEVIAKSMVKAGEVIRDIRNGDGQPIWVNASSF